MLIFTLPSWYKTEKRPENCIFIYEQMQALRQLGHRVVVLSVQPAAIGKKTADRLIDDNGIPTYYTSIPALAPSKLRAPFVSSFRKALNRLYQKAEAAYGKPDVLYAHFTFAAGVAALSLSQKTGVPLVIQEHYSGLMAPQIDGALKRYLKEAVEGADGFLCVSEGLRCSVREKTGVDKEMTVISNMIHPSFVYAPPVPHDSFIFFSCGNLIPRKRFDLLIESFDKAFHNDDNVLLRIGGAGEQRESLETQIKSLGLERRITLLGQLTREQTVEEYKRCDAFALASRAETYGLVYREALAVGRPVISTRHGGFADDWDDRFGRLTDVDNGGQLTQALRAVYEHYADYPLQTISEICLRSCSEENVARQIAAYLAQRIKLTPDKRD